MSERDRLGPGRREDQRTILAKNLKKRYGTNRQAITESIDVVDDHKDPQDINLIPQAAKVNESFVRSVIDSSISMQVQEIFEQDQIRAANTCSQYHLIESSFSENNRGRVVADDYSEDSRP